MEFPAWMRHQKPFTKGGRGGGAMGRGAVRQAARNQSKVLDM